MVLEAARRAYDVSVAHGLPVWWSESKVMSAWARVVLAKDWAAFRELEEGLAERLAVGPRGRTFGVTVHGDACLVMGEVGRGISTIDAAIAFGEDSGEGVFMAELHRIKGELLAKSDRAAADAYLTRAFELAQAASAKLFELRAAMGLARLWQPDEPSRQLSNEPSNESSDERYREAVSRLATIFDWFTEGFSCVDLTEAKQTLDAAHGEPSGARRRFA